MAAPSIVIRYLSMNTQQKPFDNVKVREAIAYAINKEALAKVAFNGYAFPAPGVVPEGVEYSVKLGVWPYDVAKAKKLLAEAGYPNGFETELWSAYNHSTAQKVTQFLQQQLGQIGIKAKITLLEAGQRVEKVESCRIRLPRPCGCTTSAGLHRPARPIGPFVRCSHRRRSRPSLFNTAYYKSDKVDGDIKAALATTDKTEKAKFYRDAQGADLEGRALGAAGRRKTAFGAQQEAHGRLHHARCVVQFYRRRLEALKQIRGDACDQT